MAGSITPLPIMLLEDEEDRKRYAALEPPKSIVVRYGYLKFIAELSYDGKDKPGCGSKMVVMTNRGVEMAEMLTTTCSNSGCGKSVSRKEMLSYIENSGGKDFPFTNQGKVVRVATHEDVKEQERLEAQKMPMIRFTKALVTELGLPMKLVDIETLLGGERIIFHYTSESWVDFRELVKQLAAEYQTRIEMHQVNARDEARLVADYEKCGQQCCCKQFLKVLKPVSMRSAKVQKATLDPTKISGRCGRLMCCLRYEDQTYEDLRKRLPHRQSRVLTVDGVGTVIDSQILTQLILVVLDSGEPPSAYPLENIEILTKEHPQFRRPEPQEQPIREPRRDRTGPSNRTGRGPGPDTRPDDRGNDRGNDRNGPRPDDRTDNRGGDARTGNDTRGDRGPQRPRPGRPLDDNQVESREGERSDQITPGDQRSQQDGANAMDPMNPLDRSDSQSDMTQDQSPQADNNRPQGEGRDGRDGRGSRDGRPPRGRDQRPPRDRIDNGPRNDAPRNDTSAGDASNANFNANIEGNFEGNDEGSAQSQGDGQNEGGGDDAPRKRRRRRRRGRGRGGNPGGEGAGPQGDSSPGPQD